MESKINLRRWNSLWKNSKHRFSFLQKQKLTEHPTAQFKISGYDIYRNDRTKGGGGIMAFVSSITPFKKLAVHRKFSTIGPLIVEVNFEKHDVVVVGIYRPSKSIDEQYYLRLEEELNNICTFASLQKQFIIVLGDLNLDRLRPERREGRILLDLEDIHGYSCLINKPTRITDHSQTLLDIVLTNKLYLFQGCDVFNPELSDHAPVYGLLKIQVKSSPFEILKVSIKKNWNTICIWHHGMLEIFLIRSRTSIASGTVYWIMSWTYMRRLRS